MAALATSTSGLCRERKQQAVREVLVTSCYLHPKNPDYYRRRNSPSQSSMPPTFTSGTPSGRKDHTARHCHPETQLSTASTPVSIQAAAAGPQSTQGHHQPVLTLLTALTCLHSDLGQFSFLATQPANFPPNHQKCQELYAPWDRSSCRHRYPSREM